MMLRLLRMMSKQTFRCRSECRKKQNRLQGDAAQTARNRRSSNCKKKKKKYKLRLQEKEVQAQTARRSRSDCKTRRVRQQQED